MTMGDASSMEHDGNRLPSRVSRAGGRLFKERLDWETGKAFRSCFRAKKDSGA